jgi:hypothetical protein
MQRDKETIYQLLQDKILPAVEKYLDPEAMTDLDGVLWALADVLCDENAPQG